MDTHYRRLIFVAVALASIFAAGTVGYVLLEGWPWDDAFYMTVITLSSVGFQEVHPLSPTGRMFTAALILLGMGTLFYGLSTATAFIIEGDLKNLLGRRKMERGIGRLHDHIILCGAGKTGKHIIEELVKTETPFVIIERDLAHIAALERHGEILYIQGDSTETETLVKARIELARGLITTLPSDKDNLFVILTARELNPRLRIVSRVIDEESRHKLTKAGADAIVSTNLIGGLRMASEMIRPQVVSFLDAMLRETDQVIRVEEVAVPPDSPLVGQTIESTRIYERVGLLVIAIKSGTSGRYVFNPPPDFALQPADILFTCGNRDQVQALGRLVAGR